MWGTAVEIWCCSRNWRKALGKTFKKPKLKKQTLSVAVTRPESPCKRNRREKERDTQRRRQRRSLRAEMQALIWWGTAIINIQLCFLQEKHMHMWSGEHSVKTKIIPCTGSDACIYYWVMGIKNRMAYWFKSDFIPFLQENNSSHILFAIFFKLWVYEYGMKLTNLSRKVYFTWSLHLCYSKENSRNIQKMYTICYIRAVRYDNIYQMDEIKSVLFHIMFYHFFRGCCKIHCLW